MQKIRTNNFQQNFFEVNNCEDYKFLSDYENFFKITKIKIVI